MTHMMMRIRVWSRQMMRCVVCEDECVTLFRCDNGHGCCLGCDSSNSDRRCPICRAPRHVNPDDTLKGILVATRARHLCSTCNVYFNSLDCEHHRAWCPTHKFTCPVASCRHVFEASRLANHVNSHDGAIDIPREFVIVVNHFSTDAVLVIDNDVIVVSTSMRNSSNVSDIMSGGIFFGIRCYYSGPTVGAWECTIRQIQTSTSHLDDEYMEEYNIGVVSAMIASRERMLVAPYTPFVMPRCMDTNPNGPRSPLVFFETGYALSKRLSNHGIRDVPRLTKPTRDVTLEGPLTCVLRVRLRRLTTPVGKVFVD